MSPQDKSPHPPILCYVTDRKTLPVSEFADKKVSTANPHDELRNLLRHIRSAQAAGIDWIQLREKDLSGKDYSLLARSALEQNSSSHPRRPAEQAPAVARIIINDRVDVAIAEQAGGVHLGENSLPTKEVRQWLRARGIATEPGLQFTDRKFLAGVSCHSLESALRAEQNGTDYIFFGPIFATPSKSEYGAPQGLARLEQVCSSLSSPVLAIGGITSENAASCIAAGAAGISAIRLFQQANDLDAAVGDLRGMDPALK